MKSILLTFFLIFILNSIFASTVGEEEFTCPISNTKFTYRVQYSFSTFGKNLDLKPFGAAIIPSPIPKCPECGFVFAENFFTDADYEYLKVHLKSNKIPHINDNYPNYYYLAEEMLIINRKTEDIAWTFLQAIWENKNKKNYEFLATKTINKFNEIEGESDFYDTSLIIKIDLLRRMGKFEESSELIQIIKMNKDLYKDYIIKIIDYQNELIATKDIEEHELPK